LCVGGLPFGLALGERDGPSKHYILLHELTSTIVKSLLLIRDFLSSLTQNHAKYFRNCITAIMQAEDSFVSPGKTNGKIF
jgi:hypothetical protein